jgi:hypothetical protein
MQRCFYIYILINAKLNKNRKDISIDSEKAFHTIPYPFMINAPKKQGIEVYIVRAMYDKTIVNIALNAEKLKHF